MPVLVMIFFQIHHHYKRLAKQLSLDNYGAPAAYGAPPGHHADQRRAPRDAGSPALCRALSDDVTAVHVSIDPAEAEKVRRKWETWGEGVRLVILDSPYRLLVEPLLTYISRSSPIANRTR